VLSASVFNTCFVHIDPVIKRTLLKKYLAPCPLRVA
jgi:hypothetical protein